MTSRSPSPPSLPSSAPPEPDQEPDVAAELPMTMAASVVLDHLPKDATRALETAGEVEIAKGM
jgi:ubiquitin-like protein ATG12